MNTKIEVIKLNNEDIITTSSHCTMDGDKSYYLFFDACGGYTTWELTLEVDGSSNPKGHNIPFSYYDEKGIEHNDYNFSNSNWPTGIEGPYGNAMWFHYKDGNFYLCDNVNHHHQYGPLE